MGLKWLNIIKPSALVSIVEWKTKLFEIIDIEVFIFNYA